MEENELRDGIPADVVKNIESIAKSVHEQWMSGRIKEGWSYGKKRNDALKQTPCMVPYEQLPEEEKAYDRNTALRVVKSLVDLGFKISRS